MLPGTFPYLIVGVLALLICWIVSTCLAAMRRFSWAAFEDMTIARPRRLAVERCIDHGQGIETFLGTVAMVCSGVLALCVFMLAVSVLQPASAENAPEKWLQVFLIALGGAFVLILAGAWALPTLFARGRAEKIVIKAAPLLVGLSGTAERVRDTLGTEDGSGGAESSSSTPQTEEEQRDKEDEEAQEFLRSVHRFQNVDASEIMTPRIDMISIESTASLTEACATAVEHGHSRFPVFEVNRDHITGVLYVKDVLRYLETDNWREMPVSDVMRQAFFIPETKSVAELLEEFQQRKVHIAVVLDEYGGTAGIVTIEDAIEEIVGEIHDEYDQEEEVLLERINEYTADVDAKIHVDELNDALDIDIPESDDYETVAGFVTSQLGSIPKVGERLEHNDIRFTVIEGDDRKIDKITVELLDPERREED